MPFSKLFPVSLSTVGKIDEGYDHVIGSRYILGGSIPASWGIHRKLVSYFGSLVARIVLLEFSVKDFTSGYKLTQVKGFLDKIDLDNLLSKRHAYKIHILYELLRMKTKVCEVPIHFKSRKEDFSKSTIEDLTESLRVILILRFRRIKAFFTN